ncbi:MAG: 2-amino-4-hydroxy-6-hydroxymethyldihydropteridine diphosphokinase [Pararhodobacter sp.]
MQIANRNRFLLALGANQAASVPENAAVVRRALAMIERAFGGTIRASRLYQTPAFPAGAGPDFVNACALADSALGPQDALEALHAIEAAMGRVRRERWGARVIDLDLLAAGDAILPDEAQLRQWMDLPAAQQPSLAPDRLILPHPRLHERAFVLVPLADVASEWRHPLLGDSVQTLLEALDPALRAEIRPI